METPQSELYLLTNVELDPDYNYTLDFENEEAQHSYFESKVDAVFNINEGYSFIRENQTIKVYAKIEDLENVNYLMFKNNQKWFYAFIDSKEYASENVTRLSFKIDVFQTFMFDYEMQESFIDREHQDRAFQASGMWNYNIEPENIEIGSDYRRSQKQILKDNTMNNDDLELYWILITASKHLATGDASSTDPPTWENIDNTLTQSGRYAGCYAYLFPVNRKNHRTEFYTPNYNGIDTRIANGYVTGLLNKSTAIYSMKVLPYCPLNYTITKIDASSKYRLVFEGGWKYLVVSQQLSDAETIRPVLMGEKNWGGVDAKNLGYRVLSLENVDLGEKTKIGVLSARRFTSADKALFDIEKEKSIENEPKLYTYPYFFYEITDHRSEPLIVKNENIPFNRDIKIKQSLGVQQKSKVWVDNLLGDNGKDYASINNGVDELPLFNNDYASYLAQSKASATAGVAVSLGASILTAGIGFATGGVGFALGAGQAIGIGQQIASEIIKKQDLKATPDTIRKQGNNIEFDLLDNNIEYQIITKQILVEFREKVWKYFFHYGYKCNDFKKPNLKSRYYFNYIKTIGANIKTNINSEYKNELMNIFNNGITIWHFRDVNTFKGVNNYDYENVEMSLIGG